VEIREFSNSLIFFTNVNVDHLLDDHQLEVPYLATTASGWDSVHCRAIIHDQVLVKERGSPDLSGYGARGQDAIPPQFKVVKEYPQQRPSRQHQTRFVQKLHVQSPPPALYRKVTPLSVVVKETSHPLFKSKTRADPFHTHSLPTSPLRASFS